MNRTFWLKKAVKILFFGAIFVTAVGYLTMSLWNHLMPFIFHLPTLNFWQTLGLLVLSRILFGGFGRGNRGGFARGRAWKQQIAQKMARFSPEEQEKFRQQMRSRCAGAWGRRGTEAPNPTN